MKTTTQTGVEAYSKSEALFHALRKSAVALGVGGALSVAGAKVLDFAYHIEQYSVGYTHAQVELGRLVWLTAGYGVVLVASAALVIGIGDALYYYKEKRSNIK